MSVTSTLVPLVASFVVVTYQPLVFSKVTQFIKTILNRFYSFPLPPQVITFGELGVLDSLGFKSVIQIK